MFFLKKICLQVTVCVCVCVRWVHTVVQRLVSLDKAGASIPHHLRILGLRRPLSSTISISDFCGFLAA